MTIQFKKYSYCLLYIFLLFLTACFKQPAKSSGPETVIVYPTPPAEPKIQYLTSFNSSVDVKGPQTEFNKFLFGEVTPLPIIKPYGITVHGSKIYICDSGIKGLEILDLKENTFEYFVPKGLGQLRAPINCHVDDRGFLFVADSYRRQVIVFNEDRKFVESITLKNNSKPTDVFTDEDKIWITAIDDHCLYKYDKFNFKIVVKVGDEKSSSKGYMYQPANIFLSDSVIHVSDIGSCQVITYSQDEYFIKAFGQPGKDFGDFTRPKGIAADKENNLYVVDAAFENVQVFNDDGDLLMYFGGTYNGPGGMWLPADVTIDYENIDLFKPYVDSRFKLRYLIFVTNQYGPDKVNVYGFVDPANE